MRFLNDNNKALVGFTFEELSDFCNDDYEKIFVVAGYDGLDTDYFNSKDSFMTISPYYFSVLGDCLIFITKNEDARLVVYEKDMKDKEIVVNFEQNLFILYFKNKIYKFECDNKILRELKDYFMIDSLPINSARR
jgi:hypothetical protein